MGLNMGRDQTLRKNIEKIRQVILSSKVNIIAID